MPSATSLLPLHPDTPYIKPTPASTHNGKTYRPTHPKLFRVEMTSNIPLGTVVSESEGETFSSRLVAEQDFAPDSTITRLTNISAAPVKAYSSVQYGSAPHEHLELNSDLLFMNHSCDPSVIVYLSSRKPSGWEVRTGSKPVLKGQDLTFFYPSTEWDMAQGFDCSCGANNCLGKIKGAKYLSLEELEKRGWVNEHIRKLKAEQELEEFGRL